VALPKKPATLSPFPFLTYDPHGRLVSRQLTGTGQTPVGLALGYNPRGQVATATRSLAGMAQGQSLFSYDSGGNLTHLQHQKAAGQVVADYQYACDSGDRLASENDNGTSTCYGYDGADQLTSAGGRTFSYDVNGNRTIVPLPEMSASFLPECP
jgi:YD repeat-containing protein